MPICEADPWRLQYFERVPCPPDVRIPTEDADAWLWHPKYRFAYDKDRDRTRSAPRGWPVWYAAAVFSGFLQANHQSQRHGRQTAGGASVQVTFHEDKDPSEHAMPPGGFRLAVINAFSLSARRVGRELLGTHFLARAA